LFEKHQPPLLSQEAVFWDFYLPQTKQSKMRMTRKFIERDMKIEVDKFSWIFIERII